MHTSIKVCKSIIVYVVCFKVTGTITWCCTGIVSLLSFKKLDENQTAVTDGVSSDGVKRYTPHSILPDYPSGPLLCIF